MYSIFPIYKLKSVKIILGLGKRVRHNSTEGLRSTSAPILRKPPVDICFYRDTGPDTR